MVQLLFQYGASSGMGNEGFCLSKILPIFAKIPSFADAGKEFFT